MIKRKDDEKMRFWQPMIDHINGTWKAATKKDFNYPFTGKDMADLRHHARNFGEWGIMATWDIYIENADEYVKKHAFDIFTFTRSLPRLLDNPRFKVLRAQYEQKLCGDLPPVIGSAIDSIKKPAPSRESKQTKLLRHYRKTEQVKKSVNLPGF